MNYKSNLTLKDSLQSPSESSLSHERESSHDGNNNEAEVQVPLLRSEQTIGSELPVHT